MSQREVDRAASIRRRRVAAERAGFIEQLEPRSVLSGTGLFLAPPMSSLSDSMVVAPPPVAATALVTALKVTLPASVPNGMPTMARIAAVDAAGTPVFGFSGSVAVSSSDAAAAFPKSVTLVNGRAFVPVTFRTSGAQTLTVSDSAAPTRSASASTVVAPALVAAKFTVLMPAQVRAGVPTWVTAVAVDAQGRPVPTFGGSATVASSDTAATLPMVEVVFANGRASFPVTLTTAGPQSVTVTSLSESPLTGTSRTTVIAPQALASFVVMVPSRVFAGSPVNVTIIAMDASRRPIPTYAGTAVLASSDLAAVLPSSVTFRSGRATARVTFSTAGGQSLRISGGVAGDIVGTGTTTVLAAPVVASFVVMLPKAVAVGTPTMAVLLAVDAAGKPVPTFSGTATLASSDAAGTMPAAVTFVNGRARARVIFATLGEQTITATSGAVTGSGKTQVSEVTVLPTA